MFFGHYREMQSSRNGAAWDTFLYRQMRTMVGKMHCCIIGVCFSSFWHIYFCARLSYLCLCFSGLNSEQGYLAASRSADESGAPVIIHQGIFGSVSDFF